MEGRTEGRRVDPLVILTLGLVVLALFHLLTGTIPASRQLTRMREGNAQATKTLREEHGARRALEDRREGLTSDPHVVERELRRLMRMVRRDEKLVVPPEAVRK